MPTTSQTTTPSRAHQRQRGLVSNGRLVRSPNDPTTSKTAGKEMAPYEHWPSPPPEGIRHGDSCPSIDIKTPDTERGNSKVERRARRTEIERLSRQRRSGQVAAMRSEVERLEKTYALLMSRETEHAQRGAIATPTRATEIRDQYRALIQETRRLREEHKVLHEMIQERQLMSVSIRKLAERFVEEDMVTWDDALFAWFDPLSMADALAIMRESCEIIAAFDLEGNFVSTGGRFMGWSDKRRIDEGTSKMLYCFSKPFPNEDAESLMRISWDKFMQERFLQKTVVSASTELYIHHLQQLTDDICVIKRRTRYPAMKTMQKFHTVYLQFRIQTEDGFIICFRTVPAPEIQNSLEEDESWVDIFQWISFRRLRDQRNGDGGGARGCEVSFGGTMVGDVAWFIRHWLIESILAVARWEGVCIPSLVLPPTEDNNRVADEGLM